MASITVTLHGALNLYLPDKGKLVRVETMEPATVVQLLESLGIPVGMLSMLLINNKRADSDSPLADGDLLEAFPYCAGG